MKRHPSGRPIRSEERRSYSMRQGFPRSGFICPRLNEDQPPQHDTYAVGFITLPSRDDLWHVTEAKKR